MNEITVRPARRDEALTLATLVHGLIDELSGGKAPTITEMAAVAAPMLERGSICGLLAFDGDRPVGVLMLNECAAIYAGGPFGEITELYVQPDYRSKGVARLLLSAAESLAAERGWKRLEVGAPDQPAWNRTLQFYLREGFSEVGPRLKKLTP